MTITAPSTEQQPYGEPPAAGAAVASGARRRYGPLVLALTLLTGLLFGAAGMSLVPGLTRPGDSSVEAGFARDMTTHHAQAVEMGLIAFQRGESPAVRTLGADIATSQQGEIGMMQTWLREWRLDPTGSQPPMAWMSDGVSVRDGLMPGMATPEQMAELRSAQGRELDVLFLNLMTRHHIGGIHMIDAALDGARDSDVRQAAQRMKNVQQNDLTNMQNLLRSLGG